MKTPRISFLFPGLLALLPVGALSAAPENLALKKDYVSSAPNPHGWDKPGLTDGVWGGDPATCFATDASLAFPKSVTVDLGASRTFSTVVFGVPAFGSTKTVEVLVSSDNKTFEPFGRHVFGQNKAQRAVLTKEGTVARYVRLTYLDYHAEAVGYPQAFMFTNELEVYDGPAPAEVDQSVFASTPTSVAQFRHDEFIERRDQAPVGLLFIGDSITDLWPRRGELTWLKFADYKPANFAISGARTEHVLWQITNGEIDGISPKVAVVHIGTNNVGRDEPEWTAAAISKIVFTLREKMPQTKILLLGIFPRDRAGSLARERNASVNRIIAKLDDGKQVFFRDIGGVFLDGNGEIPPEVMPDGLHPGHKGYQLWYDAMWPILGPMLR